MQIRHLHLVGATGIIRTAQYNEREHLVVPVVAMVEGVVWASNSETPELVPAEELAETPQQWNGRGCFAGHPKDGKTPVMANTPRTLEKSFGVIFDTVSADRILKTRRLEFDVWIDPAKAEVVGPEAVRIVERLRANEMIEVSVGALVEVDERDGTFNGQEYHSVWRNIVSDHIAFLAEEEMGACSNDAGCGAPRVAMRHLVSASGITRQARRVKLTPDQAAQAKAAPESSMGAQLANVTFKDGRSLNDVAVFNAQEIELPEAWASQAIASVTFHAARRRTAMDKNQLLKERCAEKQRAAEGMSAHATKRAIDAALRATEPGYMGIDDYYPDDGYVIYYVAPEDVWKMKRSSYTIGKDGTATLTGKAVEVEPVTTYEPIAATKKKLAAAVPPRLKAADCGCKGDNTMTRAEMIAALVTDKHSGFKDGDEPFLETASDARLEEFRSAADVNRAAAGTITKLETDNRNLSARLKVTEERLRVAEAPLSDEEFTQRASPALKSILDERKAAEDGLKASLVSQLKDLGANTEDDLKKMSIGQLQTLAAYARIEVPDFSGRAMPRLNSRQETNDDFIPPDPYAAGLKSMQAKIN